MKRHAAAVALAGSALVMALGAVLLVLAMRPSRFVIEPGDCIHYHLVTESAEILDDGSERAAKTAECDLLMVGTGPDNQALLAVVDQRQAETALVEIGDNGAMRITDVAGRTDDGGLAQGWFDLSLCVLPPGNDQVWTADLVYAALPAHRRAIQAKVRRTRSGSAPEFQLKLPNVSVEWINAAGRYEQIRDLVCTYKFSNSRHAVETAEVRLVSAAERDDGRHRYRWRIGLSLVARTRLDDRPSAIRDLGLTGAALGEALAGNQRERAMALVTRLGGIDVDDPRLREIARRLADRARIPPPPAARPRWAVQVLTVPMARKAEADRIARQLAKQGYKAYVAPRADGVAVMVGPFETRDPALTGALAGKVPLSRPAWLPVARE